VDVSCFSRLIGLAAAAALSLSPLSAARAEVIVNGDFADSTDLAGWTVEGAIIGEFHGDFALLVTDGTDRRTLSQSLVIPSGPSVLAFDFGFSTDASSDPCVGSGPSCFPDSFAVSLIADGGASLDILVADAREAIPDPSDGRESQNVVLPIEVQFSAGVAIQDFERFPGGTSWGGHVSLALPASVRGLGATLYFDLYDQGDGAESRAAIDHVSLTTAVPAPATLSLLLVGLGVGRRIARQAPSRAAINPSAQP
jgi:hypothetical protein